MMEFGPFYRTVRVAAKRGRFGFIFTYPRMRSQRSYQRTNITITYPNFLKTILALLFLDDAYFLQTRAVRLAVDQFHLSRVLRALGIPCICPDCMA